jgi:hypothetical protein
MFRILTIVLVAGATLFVLPAAQAETTPTQKAVSN